MAEPSPTTIAHLNAISDALVDVIRSLRNLTLSLPVSLHPTLVAKVQAADRALMDANAEAIRIKNNW